MENKLRKVDIVVLVIALVAVLGVGCRKVLIKDAPSAPPARDAGPPTDDELDNSADESTDEGIQRNLGG